MKEFIDKLNLPFEGKYIDNSLYIIDLNNSNDFSDLYNAISLNKDLRLEGDSVATVDSSKFVFTDGYFEVILEADYDNDFYRLSVGER